MAEIKGNPGKLPQELSLLAGDPRVRVRRSGEPATGGRCVVYWMQRAQRALDNPALDTAVDVANALDLPLIVFFSVIASYPHANERHYVFMNQGFADIEEGLAERNIPFVLRRPPGNSLEAFLSEVGAAILIGDENHCREPERWRAVLAKRLRIPFWTVDADVIVPSALFSRRMYSLRIFRPNLAAELPRYLIKRPVVKPSRKWKELKGLDRFPVKEDITQGWKALDRTVGPVDSFTGGTSRALERLKEFVGRGLSGYVRARNHPEIDGTSRLSPYLHFGQIGPLTIALAVNDAVRKGTASQEARDAYLDELIGWRELAINFVKFNPEYDSLDCAEPWARKTLLEHANDRRAWIYTTGQLSRAETHDDLWNAAQHQMIEHGWMHNYMRMYWAKKILEWSPDPSQAFEMCVTLNDRFFLDGRDPNGYAGIAWSIAGKFDRPWFDRPIFGTIRYMSEASTGRKFDSKKYIRQMSQGIR